MTENIIVQVNDGSQFGLMMTMKQYMVIREINSKDSVNIQM